MSTRFNCRVRLVWAVLAGGLMLAAIPAGAEEAWVSVGPGESAATRKVVAALDELTTMHFIETPLTDVVDYLKDLHSIPIELDRAAMKAAGIDTDVPVTRNLENITLRSALRLILVQLELTYVLQDEVLLITTPAAGAVITHVRVYNVAGLLTDELTSADLVKLLSELFTANTACSGAATKRTFLPYGRFLIVRDTTQGHEEVAKFLQTMRSALEHDESAPGEPAAKPGEQDDSRGKLKRDAATQTSRLKVHGGTADGQAAVATGLKWLAEHQSPDGSWSFDHTTGSCQGRCKNQGALTDARIAATSLALLPFLGAGRTHAEGNLEGTVANGLRFLVRSIKISDAGADLTESGGTMYSHGLATLVLCEAYGLTRDRALHPAAQGALDYIAHAQDPQGGGWRYMPRQSGDTSVSGWQIMALYAGRRAGLEVSDATLQGASRFLDSVQADEGAGYGYTMPGIRETTSAIGLLCRTYEGWDRDHEALARGVRNIAKRQPVGSAKNHYHRFFANQCLFHATGGAGEIWESWHTELRDHLIGSQIKDDHERGSWFQTGDVGADRAGRLYCTALALLCLEVYYR